MLQQPHRPPDARRAARGSTARSSTPRTRSRSSATTPRPGTLDVVVIRLRWMSNFTDVDALAAEPGVSRPLHALPRRRRARRPRRPARHEGHRRGPQAPPRTTASTKRCQRRTGPILGICGGYQMLGHRDRGRHREPTDSADGLGLLTVNTTLRAARSSCARSQAPSGASKPPATRSATAASTATSRSSSSGNVLGTAWHGLLEGDAIRRKLLAWVAERSRPRLDPGHERVPDVREAAPRPARGLVRRPRRRRPHSPNSSNTAPRKGCPTIPPGGAACSVY